MDASSVEGGTVMAGCILFGPSYLLERHLAEWRHLIERRHIAGAGGGGQSAGLAGIRFYSSRGGRGLRASYSKHTTGQI